MAESVAGQLRDLFQQDPNLPTLPDHVRRIMALIADEDVSFAALAEEVRKDPALALRIVRLANSAAYQQAQEVTSLERAFAVIGMEQLASVLAGVAAVERCQQFVGDPRFDWGRFWGHSSGTAFIAGSLAQRLGLDFRGEEFLAGLLHDIGYLALARLGKIRFRTAVRRAAEQHGFLARELEALFGISVDEAGDILAEVSHLAPGTRAVVRHHREPAGAPAELRPLVAVVSLANQMAHLAGMTFFRGTADVEIVVTELPAWRILSAGHPEMARWDVARLVFELEREHEATQEFVESVGEPSR